MFTIILAFINSKYDTGYELLFLGTFLIDWELIKLVFRLLFGDCL